MIEGIILFLCLSLVTVICILYLFIKVKWFKLIVGFSLLIVGGYYLIDLSRHRFEIYQKTHTDQLIGDYKIPWQNIHFDINDSGRPFSFRISARCGTQPNMDWGYLSYVDPTNFSFFANFEKFFNQVKLENHNYPWDIYITSDDTKVKYFVMQNSDIEILSRVNLPLKPESITLTNVILKKEHIAFDFTLKFVQLDQVQLLTSCVQKQLSEWKIKNE